MKSALAAESSEFLVAQRTTRDRMKPSLVILAAGAGTRYGGLKQLAPIGPNDETLLEYSAFDALRVGFERVVLVVRPEAESTFRTRLEAGLARQVPVVYVHQRLDDLPIALEPPVERTRPWGTGQAVLASESAIDGPFAVVNADDFYGAEAYEVLCRFLTEVEGRADLAAVGFRLAGTLTDAGPVSRAVLEVGDDGSLRRVVEILEVWRQNDRIRHRHDEDDLRTLGGDELVSMNMWGFTPQLFPQLRRQFADFLKRFARVADAEFLLPDVVQCLVGAKRFRVEVLRGGDDWCGMTYREDLRRVRVIISSLVGQGRYPAELWA